ncbi:hypothetical protein NP493_728g00012 [Ridgeia piscesae]|uniref:Uncharacterized protein n=1 Tax=Ridgeia piscesae TaxID=27915 RepID=A0AAD9KPW8_RIDPI|nr:hypothetical protein NP493_728g00012 [Ridgeia piscesae]
MVNTPYYYYQPVGRQDIRHEDEPTSYLPMSCHLDPPEREVVDVDILERKASGDQTVVVRGVVSDKETSWHTLSIARPLTPTVSPPLAFSYRVSTSTTFRPADRDGS